jgi:hypothetical protein
MVIHKRIHTNTSRTIIDVTFLTYTNEGTQGVVACDKN